MTHSATSHFGFRAISRKTQKPVFYGDLAKLLRKRLERENQHRNGRSSYPSLMSQVIETSVTINAENSLFKASKILAEHTGLSQASIKEAMQKGAVWLHRGQDKKRLRRASKRLTINDELFLNYDADILSQKVPEPQLIHDEQHYSVWFKPYGLACQGSRWGDFASINRWVETNLHRLQNCAERPALLVHRLDRATSGLMLICHSKQAARQFSELFQTGKVDKRYQAVVHGDFSQYPPQMEITSPVDGKAAKSLFTHVEKDRKHSLLDIQLLTGRKHQIRKHLSELEHPIVGDRLYGKAEEGEIDLQLQSVSLQFTCPIGGKEQHFSLAHDKRLSL